MNLDENILQTVDLKKTLIKKRKELRDKLDLLKKSQLDQEQKFLPITKHLETIADKLIETKSALPLNFGNKTPKNEKDIFFDNEDLAASTPAKKKKKKLPIVDTPVSSKSNRLKAKARRIYENIEALKDDLQRTKSEMPEDGAAAYEYDPAQDPNNYDFEELLDQSVKENKRHMQQYIGTQSFTDYLTEFHELPRNYIEGLVHNDSEYDHKTGVRHDSIQEKYYIGSAVIDFIGPDIKVGHKLYKGTTGLYELLFKNYPQGFSKDDEDAYKEILDTGNAYRVNFDPLERKLGLRTDKYRNIIKPLVGDVTLNTSKKNIALNTSKKNITVNTSKRFGKGIYKEVNDNFIDHVYWDDPNELVNRLRLLVASQTAGHTGHTNEIVSIVEELRESGIIK